MFTTKRHLTDLHQSRHSLRKSTGSSEREEWQDPKRSRDRASGLWKLSPEWLPEATGLGSRSISWDGYRRPEGALADTAIGSLWIKRLRALVAPASDRNRWS